MEGCDEIVKKRRLVSASEATNHPTVPNTWTSVVLQDKIFMAAAEIASVDICVTEQSFLSGAKKASSEYPWRSDPC